MRVHDPKCAYGPNGYFSQIFENGVYILVEVSFLYFNIYVHVMYDM